MYVEIPSNEAKIYEQVLTFMNPFFNLTPNEIKVVAAILRVYKQTEGAAPHIRWGYVFSSKGREEMMEMTEMDSNKLGLTFSALRKKEFQGEPILYKEPSELNPRLIIDPLAYNEITIKFVLPMQPIHAQYPVTPQEAHHVEEQETIPDDTHAPETEGNTGGDSEEVQSDADAGYSTVVEPVYTDPPAPGENVGEGRERDLPPGFRSSFYD